MTPEEMNARVVEWLAKREKSERAEMFRGILREYARTPQAQEAATVPPLYSADVDKAIEQIVTLAVDRWKPRPAGAMTTPAKVESAPPPAKGNVVNLNGRLVAAAHKTIPEDRQDEYLAIVMPGILADRWRRVLHGWLMGQIRASRVANDDVDRRWDLVWLGCVNAIVEEGEWKRNVKLALDTARKMKGRAA